MDGFEALADPIRRDLLRQLGAGPARVVDLTAAYDVSRPAVSRHLRLLTEAGVARAEDRGRERHYRLEPAGLAPVRRLLDELASAPTPSRIPESALDAIDTEVHRARRARRSGRAARDAQQHREGAG